MLNGRGTSRRGFVERVTAGALAIGVGSTSFPEIAEAANASAKPDDSWLQGIKGNHAQIFDMPKADGGFSLFHVNNYLDTYKSAFNIVPPNVVAIVSLYSMTTPMGFNDAMWAKYPFGTATNTLLRGTKTAVTRNAYLNAPAGAATMGLEGIADIPASSTIAALQTRGARFILCNNAFNFWVGRLAAGGAGSAADIRAELEKNMIPGVTIVPAMVIAMNQAQQAGATYMYL